MKVFFTSDQHFCHTNVIKYDGRPFADAEEMNAELIRKWNQKVRKDDMVWFLGDLMLSKNYDKACKIVSQLHGRKMMIFGNHDHFKVHQYESMGFEFVSKYPVVLKQHFILSHAPMPNFTEDKEYYYIYGHVHNHPDFADTTDNSTCVCCNRWNYEPIQIAVFDNYQEPKFKNPAEEARESVEQK